MRTSNAYLQAFLILYWLVTCWQQADAVELALIRATTVEKQTLTFAEGPATKFGNTVNGRTHQQTPLVTYRGYQYVTFFDAQRRVCIGRRDIKMSDWDVIHFNDHRFKTNDSHNTAVLGICDKDGTIHMLFDHHASVLNYRISKRGAAHKPDSVKWNKDLFTGVLHTLGSVKTDPKVTYPRFFPAPNGNLMLYYRNVTSGNGNGVIQEYNGSRHDWTRRMGVFISRDIGTFTANGRTSKFRCPYMNSLSYAGDRLHASWIWRDRFEKTSAKNQHDLCYAYSDDDGRTWQNSAGKLIGRTGQKFIHLDSPGLVVVPIPINAGLTNQNTHYAFPDGSIHVVMGGLWPDEKTGKKEKRYFHLWRTADGKWDFSVLPYSGDRPKLVGAENQSLVLLYTRGNQLYVAAAQPNPAKNRWKWASVKLPGKHPCYGDALVDLQRWEEDQVLSIYSQDPPAKEIETTQRGSVSGLPVPLYVVEYRFK